LPGDPGVHGGAELDLLDGVASSWQTDDFWQHALYAAVAYIRAAVSRADVRCAGRGPTRHQGGPADPRARPRRTRPGWPPGGTLSRLLELAKEPRAPVA
jgi:hypothetical protein